MPKVSVIIPTFNASDYLPETIASIRAQDFYDYEIIIVDDRSTDNTKEVVHRLGGEGIRYYCLERNHGGPSRPRNFGIQMAAGQYIAFCDADDIWLPNHLQDAVTLLDFGDELALVFTDAEKFDDSNGGNPLGMFLVHYDQFESLPKVQVAEHFYTIESGNAFPCLFFEQYIMPSGVVARKSIFQDVGKFDESLLNADDLDMWFRISRSHALGYIGHPGFRYRMRSDSISGRGPALAENRSKVLRKQMEQGLPANLDRRCLQMSAVNNYEIGYYYQTQLQMSKAREQFLLSFRTFRNWAAAKGLLISILGAQLYDTLRRIKHGLNS